MAVALNNVMKIQLMFSVPLLGLTQNTQVKVPATVTEGQQTTLTCTAPGLCSGPPPPIITWTWRKKTCWASHARQHHYFQNRQSETRLSFELYPLS